MLQTSRNRGKSRRKWIVPAVAFCFICAVVVPILSWRFVDQLPERDLARDFVLANQRLQRFFGIIESVSYSREAGGSVAFKQGRREGHYCFKVEGGSLSGTIKVRWHSEGSGVNFTVETVELLEPWKSSPEVIWSRQ